MTEDKKIHSSKGDMAISIHHPKETTERLAILCPGLLDSKDYKHLVGLANDLCDKMSYTVVRLQPTGTWESDGDISDYTTTQYLDDIQYVVEYMLDFWPFKHIFLGGHSRGGKVSLLYAARDPRISAVLGIMPSSSQNKRHGTKRVKWEKRGYSLSLRDLPDNEQEKREFRLPYSHALDNDRYTVLDVIKNIKALVFLFAGEKDEAIPPLDVKNIYKAANEPKRFVVFPNIGHDYRKSESETKIVNGIILKEFEDYFPSPSNSDDVEMKRFQE